MLLMDFSLIDKANQCQAFVNFSQVENDVLLIVCVSKADDGAGLSVELRATAVLVNSVDAGHINKDVNQF